ncbi:MAG: DUF87 domain-containing protein [Candidatus Thiodiazotropha sp. (ex Lucinoma borealis)]|nr:DUF87 domain-containing protein [Candidatus Thiodiazotropha sp. (ex Lucinoma borealis)]
MSSNWKNWLLGSVERREHKETRKLHTAVTRSRSQTPFTSDREVDRFIIDLIFDICEECGVSPTDALGNAFYTVIHNLLCIEGFLFDPPEADTLKKLTLEEGVQLRALLRHHLRFLNDHERLLPIWRDKLFWLFSGTLRCFPLSAFTDIEDENSPDTVLTFPETRAAAVCDNLPEVLDRILVTLEDKDLLQAHLFDPLRERLYDNLFRASGIPVERHNDPHARVVMPTANTIQSPDYLIDAYLEGTPLHDFFRSPLPFTIPFPARFEHTHVVGGTGHGKTQLLQFLIHHDLVRSIEDGRSVVVLDSHGDLIQTLSHLACFSPTNDTGLSDRLVMIDPHDIDHPVSLNMFDFKRSRLSGYAPVDQEKILNATIELYEYFFGALLGAELTQRQGLVFKYLARLLLEIPGATIHTLRELMEDGEPFRPYMAQLTGTARSFFATRFFDRSFNETKKQILTRLWGVLSNSTLERMFSHAHSTIDMFELLNDGKIILINTAKDLLGEQGTAIFGRFFIALIAQAAVQRAALPVHDRRPAFVYVDEAQDYFDENISHILNQARKYRVGLVFAHQYLDQLSNNLRSSVLTSTTIKFAGGISAKDARMLADEYRSTPDFFLAQRKGTTHTSFACHVRNYTKNALSLSIPLGFVEAQPQLSETEHRQLLECNRQQYCAPPSIPDDAPFPVSTTAPEQQIRNAVKKQPIAAPTPQTPESAQAALHTVENRRVPPASKQEKRTQKPSPSTVEPAPQGRGGRQHKYLQKLVKSLAEDRGFRASIEESILNGTGHVDVSLKREQIRLAVEISVTTTRDHELGNVEKCLAAGYQNVVLIGATARHIQSLAKFIEENLEEHDQGKVHYTTPEGMIDYLDSLGVMPKTTEQIVRGYKVRTTHQTLNPADAAARRQAITSVITRSLRRSKDT